MATARDGRSVSPATLARQLDRILANVVTAVDAIIVRPHPAPGTLHRLHRELRRLRTALTVWEHLLSPRQRKQLGPLDDRLKRLARLVGRIRDRDIAIELLARVDGLRRPRSVVTGLSRYRTRLRDDARTGRELLRAFLRAEHDAQLFTEIQLRWNAPAIGYRSKDVGKLLVRTKLEEVDRVNAAHRHARRKPSATRLHQLRIRVRGWRHLADLARTLDPRQTPTFPAPLRRLQRDLGHLHDLDVVLADLPAEVQRTDWASSLRVERRDQRKKVLAALRRGPRSHPFTGRRVLQTTQG